MGQELDLKAREDTIEDILFSISRFRIPRYQRPYSWGHDQVSDLWEDLISRDDSYFMGAFIFNYETFEESRAVEVIDGQQRLLTITIIMAVLRDIAKSLGSGDVADLYQRQCIMFEDKKGKQAPRIECGDSTIEFFRKYIQNMDNGIRYCKPDTEEKDKIKKNYLFFYEKISTELSKFSEKSRKL